MREWKPIEDAPKDGTVIILLKKTEVTAGLWDSEDDKYPWTFLDNGVDIGNVNGWKDGKHGPTHWMPLPPPPKA
jgi:hypothetical protein